MTPYISGSEQNINRFSNLIYLLNITFQLLQIVHELGFKHLISRVTRFFDGLEVICLSILGREPRLNRGSSFLLNNEGKYLASLNS